MRVLHTIAPWPIIEREKYELEPFVQQRIAEYALACCADEPALQDPEPFGPSVRHGWRPVPTLYLEDHRSIQLQPPDRARLFEYRSFALSSPDDIYLRSNGRVKSFERYMRNNLGFGAKTVLTVDLSEQIARQEKGSSVDEVDLTGHHVPTLAHACLHNSSHMEYLVSRAKQSNGLNICPFLVDNDIWMLADELNRRSESLITVMGPTPRLAARSNDKLWFFDMARTVLGKEHMPLTLRAYTLVSAVGELRYLAKKTTKVVLKTTASAGSQGNLAFYSKDLLELSEKDCQNLVKRRLLQTGWKNSYPLLIASWEAPVHASPSAQVWIPSAKDGLPIIEALFAQILAGEGAGFIGARQADLRPLVKEKMVQEVGMLASCLQHLGYFGRVSFDAIVIGHNDKEAELHWIECNARWGGVSIPMTVSNRLSATHKYFAPCMRVIQKSQEQFTTPSFVDYCTRLGGDLLDTRSGTDGIVCLTPAGEMDATVVLLILAHTEQSATQLSEKAVIALSSDVAAESAPR